VWSGSISVAPGLSGWHTEYAPGLPFFLPRKLGRGPGRCGRKQCKSLASALDSKGQCEDRPKAEGHETLLGLNLRIKEPL
jgi:hypothetical protein